jgi:hypothetical protein
MNKVELFIKEKGIKVIELEKELGLPFRSIKISDRGIPKKYLDKIVEYLKNKYGFDGYLPNIEVDEPISVEIIIKKSWNKDFIPDYKDGIVRYQDPENGLWKRLSQWQTELKEVVDDKTGEVTKVRKIKDDFLPLTDEIFVDKIGGHYISKCGIKVYKFDKQ